MEHSTIIPLCYEHACIPNRSGLFAVGSYGKTVFRFCWRLGSQFWL